MSTTAVNASRTGQLVDDVPRQRAGRPEGKVWAATGLAAGLAGLVGIQASMAIDAVYDPELVGDPVGIVEKMSESTAALLVFHTATMLSVVLIVVFAAGLRRRLRATAPAGSLLPEVAASGLGLVAVAGLMGTALNTEFIFGLQDVSQMVPESGVFYGHWVGTVAWLWVGAGLSGVAVAVAALRHRALPRWIGWTSLVLGGVTLLLGISPLQYMAGMTGPLWLTLVGLGFLAGDRAFRAGR